MSQRRLQEKENMKTNIIDASIKIINQEGYEKLSMRKIAQIIDYSPTTLYLYYNNKAEIAADIGMIIYDRILSDTLDVYKANLKQPLLVQLKQVFRQFVLSMTYSPEMGIAFIRSGSETLFKASEGGNEGENLLQQLLYDGYKRELLSSVNSHSSWMIVTSLLGFGMNAIENKLYLEENWEELIESYIDMIIYGIKGESV
ncbi:hypothetical protein AOC36_03795 [Erysipelothrix larvae]|uniref:HTH tetR-type domain-containing protein n=1 Tax=Erysipelothrix larvae TaxID=1514105 RepID=A0A0X8GZ99_9FIRM|nr:TetR/AcrR family transcriptional regulator [Erysipelothrix larvae]AMC93125.1 hypothetical protein AOC36_03795 [Erysipelothrix larvae]